MKLNYNSKHSKKYVPQKYKKERNFFVTIFEYLLGIAYFFGVLAVSLLPNIEEINHNAWFITICTVVTVAVHLFYIIAEKEHSHPAFSAAMILAIPTYLLYLFCNSGRLFYGIYCFLLPVFIALFIIIALHQKKEKSPCDIAIGTVLMLVLINVSTCWFITFENESDSTKYLWISLAGAIICVVLCLLLLLKGVLKFEETSSNILSLVFAFIISFLVISSFLYTFNYCFDTSKPEIIAAEVVDKATTGSGRTESHHIYVNVNNQELEFRVGYNRYKNMEIGEKININLYDGFFGDAYFILD